MYLEKEGFDLATVPTHLFRVLRIEKVPGWYPGIRNTLVVAEQPHKHIWKSVLGLEEVKIHTHMHTRTPAHIHTHTCRHAHTHTHTGTTSCCM